MLADYYKANSKIADLIDSAIKVIKWFNNHSYALGLFNAEQLATDKLLRQPLALILPVITRWTSHFCALARLLAVNKPMKLTVTRCEDELIDSVGTKQKSKAKARKIFKYIMDTDWWKELAMCVKLF
jgi:hypothetical protein